MADKRDLLILGGGLVGMTLALAAARKGISSHVIDRADPAELTAEGFDGRASAISTASWNLFENIGLAGALAPHGCPIASIAVTDGMKPGRIDFQPEPHEGSLGLMFANRQLRLALVGDAGHGLHPIAGQGLNVGLRDVGALVEVIADGMRLGLDPGDAQLLTRYERWRGLDTFMVALATDGLTRLFGIPGRLPSAIRRLGMGIVQRTPGLKHWFMDEARGTSGKLPELLRG